MAATRSRQQEGPWKGDGDSFAIDAAAFAIPPSAAPRPWDRVLVSSTSAIHKQKMIWKRVAGVFTTNEERRERDALAELDSQGFGSRKRARFLGYIPCLTVAGWKPTENHDAHSAIGTAKEDVEGALARMAVAPVLQKSRLQKLPMKRDSTRRPIGSFDSKKIVPSATLQPPVLFKAPSTAKIHETEEMTSTTSPKKDVKRRRIRRLSRRLTLAPSLEEISDELPPSPSKTSKLLSSPLKKPIPKDSPRKRISPLKPFTITATPSKATLEPTLKATRSPVRSPKRPLLFSPISEEPRIPKCLSPAKELLSPAHEAPLLIFGQSIANIDTSEPEHEKRRRRSLHVARRVERRVSRLPFTLRKFEPELRKPNRRHTSVHFGSPKSNDKDRRKTAHVPGVWAVSSQRLSAVSDDPGASTQLDKGIYKDAPARDAHAAFLASSAVDVDVRKNLDIFGPLLLSSSPPARKWTDDEETHRFSIGAPRSPPTSAIGEETPHTMSVASSPQPQAGRLDEEASMQAAEEARHFVQAATPPPATPPPASKESAITDSAKATMRESSEEILDEGAEPMAFNAISDEAFTSYCPLGLSPIIEESLVVDRVTVPPARPLPESLHAEPFEGELEDGLAAIGSDLFAMSSPNNGATSMDASRASAPSPSTDRLSHKLSAEIDVSMLQPVHSDDDPAAAGHYSAGSNPLQAPGDDAPSERSLDEFEDEDSDFENEQEDVTRTNPIYLESDMTEEVYDLGEADAFMPIGTAHEAAFSSSPTKPTNSMEAQAHSLVTLRYDPTMAMDSLNHNVEEAQAFSNSAADDSELPAQTNMATAKEQPAVHDQGFTPINDNVRRQSSDHFCSTPLAGAAALAFSPVGLEIARDAGTTVRMGMDFDAPTIIPPPSLPHDDSDTELLRKFVGRVRAGKLNAEEEAPAARALLHGKRRSGSMASTASGSPIAKGVGNSSTPTRGRTPLGMKDLNSPSPSKKRKLKECDCDKECVHEMRQHKASVTKTKVVEQQSLFSPSKSKKRRKHQQQRIETNNAAIFDPEYQPTLLGDAAAPRRSTRARTARIQLRPAAGGTAAAADDDILSAMISVRLPGSSAMSDTDVSIALARNRKEEKDLSALTRVNTRKNKGGALPPKEVLGDPSWIEGQELERLGSDETVAKEESSSSGGDDDAVRPSHGAMGRKTKEVRWAEALVSVQEHSVSLASKVKGKGVFASAVAKAMFDFEPEPAPAPETELDEGVNDANVEPAETVLSEVPSEQTTSAAKDNEEAEPIEEAKAESSGPAAEVTKPASAARVTRASRLKAPTPRRSLGVGASSIPTPIKPAPPTRPLAEAPTKASAAGSVARKPGGSNAKAAPPAEDAGQDEVERRGRGSLAKSLRGLPAQAPMMPSQAQAPPVRMATRRTKIASLGMGANGTPAPKRRTRGT